MAQLKLDLPSSRVGVLRYCDSDGCPEQGKKYPAAHFDWGYRPADYRGVDGQLIMRDKMVLECPSCHSIPVRDRSTSDA